jgi:N-methylhydantoinase B
MTLDPITLALVQNRLNHITQQMGSVMLRTARSPIFSHAHDFSCFITDAHGSVVAQADGIPIHTGGGGFAARALLKQYGGRISDGDIFILSDPYAAGGNHLPDWVIARPVFSGGNLVAFTCNRAHQSDIGGGAAGTYNPEAKEIFHEGIRLPVMRLADKGEVNDDIWRLLLLNSRTAHLLDGDLRAMIGSTGIGAEKIQQLMAEIGAAEGAQYFDGILDYADRRFRHAIAELPHGRYEGESWFDNDCFDPMDIPIRVAITVDDTGLAVDFTGSHPQIRGFKNSSLANTYSAVYTALFSFFDPDIPRNEGAFRSVRIIAPSGTIVNPEPPAALTMCTVFPACEIIEACWEALGSALPGRSCAGWGANSFPISAGVAENGRTFVMYHWAGSSGGGAVDGRDGFPQQGGLNSLCGLVIPNIETFEQLYPVHIEKHELRCDSAGPGKYRGGPGVAYEVRIKRPVQLSFRGEGMRRFAPRGAAGGGAGALGQLHCVPDVGEAYTPPAYGIRHSSPCRFSMKSQGGGGWGDPLERVAEHVLGDVRDGIVSREMAFGIYGVVIAADGRSIEIEATRKKRDLLRRNTTPAAPAGTSRQSN